MTMNLIVVSGAVQFVLAADVVRQSADSPMLDVLLSPASDDTYGRLTVPPGYWMAFQGIGRGENVLMNVASIEHDPAESETLELEAIPWKWLPADVAIVPAR